MNSSPWALYGQIAKSRSALFVSTLIAHRGRTGSAEQAHLRTIAALRDKLQRKNEVVAELMEEHIQLKKELGEL